MDRRNFLKFGSLAAGTYAFVGCGTGSIQSSTDKRTTGAASAKTDDQIPPPASPGAPTGETKIVEAEIYTKEAPGKWAGKEASHLPKLTAVDGRLLLKTEHTMAADHYISRHQLQDSNGNILFDRRIAANGVPESKFALPAPAGLIVSAFSSCNLHGIWKEDFKIADLRAGFLISGIYTAENPGPWTGKEAGHLPTLKSARALANGNYSLEVTTNHVMTPEHYIYQHEIRNFQGEILAKSYLAPEVDKASVSFMEIPAPQSGIQLISACNLHGIWLAQVNFDKIIAVYTSQTPGPTGAAADHVPTIQLTDTSALSNPSHTVTVTNTHEMLAGTHFVFKHQVRSIKGELVAERVLNPAVNTTAVSLFEGRLFQSALGQFSIYAYCNLHGIWKNDVNFEQVNVTYTDTPGPAGGAAATHRPLVTVEAEKISVKTEHAMTVEHYISKHQVRKVDGSLIYEKNFPATGVAPLSVYPKTGLLGPYIAYSFCNLHGIWKAPFTV